MQDHGSNGLFVAAQDWQGGIALKSAQKLQSGERSTSQIAFRFKYGEYGMK